MASDSMQAMVFDEVGQPLRLEERPIPQPGPGELLIRVLACGVCRTDLHLLDGEVDIPHPPRVLGHMIVGEVHRGDRPDRPGGGRAADDQPGGGRAAERGGGRAADWPAGRIGVPWLGWVDGTCEYCRSGRENLCPNARFTGRDIDGGFAQYTVADARFCLPIPAGYSDEQAAPLMCAGLIGYRALRMCGDARRIGFYGFGDSAHILAQVCRWQGRSVYAFTRPGDESSQDFARELGAVWAGGSDQAPSEPLDAAIIFAPAGPLVAQALLALAPGGIVVCAGIHMSEIPSFPYSSLWQERVVRSVANLTRADGSELLALAPQVPVRTSVATYPLERANDALADLRAGRFHGAAVLVP